MRKFDVICKIAVIACNVVILGALCGCSDFVTNGINGKFHDSSLIGGMGEDLSGYEIGNAEINDSISNLDIEWIAGKVTVDYHDADTIVIEESSNITLDDKDKLRYIVENGTLKVRFCEHSVRTFNLSKSLVVTLPKDASYGEIKIDGVSSDFVFPTITAGELDIDTVSGSVNCDDVNVTGAVNFDATSGDFNIKNSIKAESLDTDAVSGGIYINNASVANGIRTNSTSGNIEIVLADMCNIDTDGVSASVKLDVPEDASFVLGYDTVSGSLSMKSNAQIQGDEYQVGDGKYKVNVNTTSGNLDVLTH